MRRALLIIVLALTVGCASTPKPISKPHDPKQTQVDWPDNRTMTDDLFLLLIILLTPNFP